MESRWWDTHVRGLRALLLNPAARPELPAEEESARASRLAHTLELLFPRVVTPRELVDSLHQPRGYVIGYYSAFLCHELPLMAKDHPALIPPLLRWWTQQPHHDIEWNLDRHEVTAWTVAWEHRADPVIWAALVETFYTLLRQFAAPEHFNINQADRRRFLQALWSHHHAQPEESGTLFSLLSTHNANSPQSAHLLHLDDIHWCMMRSLERSATRSGFTTVRRTLSCCAR
jgi:hypothetical protein